MLSRKCLMFNISFIIFNSLNKNKGILSVIFMVELIPLQVKCHVSSVLIHDSTTAPSQQAEDIQLKAVVPPIEVVG